MRDQTLLDPKVDFIFKRIFGSENDTDILICFLNAIFKEKHTVGEYDPIISVSILNNEITKESMEDKNSILDIKAKTAKGEIINIEIQRKDEGNLLKRSLYYLCRIITEQLESGNDYNTINRAVTIIITDFKTKFVENDHFHNTYNLFNNMHKTMLTDLIELHLIELPKMKNFDEDNVLQLFLQFLIDPDNEMVEEKSNQIQELSKAKQKLKRLSRDPKTRIEFEAREKALKDKTSSLNYARAEGEILGYDKAKAEIEEANRIAEEAKAKAEEAEARAKVTELNTKLESAKSFLDILDDLTIANKLGLDVSQVAKLREEME